MSSMIDELEEWLDSLTDDELLELWDKSTEGMRNTSQYEDFFSDRPFEFECKFPNESEDKYRIEKSNLTNNSFPYTPDNIGSFLFFTV